MNVEIEVGSEVAESKLYKIHAAGCKDLRDGWELGFCANEKEAFEKASHLGSHMTDEIETGQCKLAPCARALKS